MFRKSTARYLLFICSLFGLITRCYSHVSLFRHQDNSEKLENSVEGHYEVAALRDRTHHITSSSNNIVKILEGDERLNGEETEVSATEDDVYDDYDVVADASNDDPDDNTSNYIIAQVAPYIGDDSASNEYDDAYMVTEDTDNKHLENITDRPTDSQASAHHPKLFELGPVDRDVFMKTLASARSYRDVLRLFHRNGATLEDGDIDDAILSHFVRTEPQVEKIARLLRTHVTRDQQYRLLELQNALKHYQEMLTRSRCERPVAQLVNLREEFGQANREFLPECTVVYRCHNDAGCCNSVTSECAAKTSTIITRSVWELEHIVGHMNVALPTIRLIELVNHTECYCKPLETVARCLQCPWPFQLGEATSCDCQCTQRHHCAAIQHGFIPLRQADIQCIEKSKCQVPHCEYGDYDVTTGYCPCRDIECASHHAIEYDVDDTLDTSGDIEDDDDQYLFSDK